MEQHTGLIPNCLGCEAKVRKVRRARVVSLLMLVGIVVVALAAAWVGGGY